MIDDIHYISYPTPCSEDLSNIADPSSNINVITLFNVVIAIVRENAINKKLNKSSYEVLSSGADRLKKIGLDPISFAMGLTKDPVAPSIPLIRR